MLTPDSTILKYPWHTGHDYELCRIPCQMVMLGSTHRRWSTGQRPLPDHVQVEYEFANARADVMILHVDQWTWHEIDKRFLFEHYRDNFHGPKIIINHGCNLVDGCSNDEMKRLVQDNFMVCNSPTAQELWEVERSRFIRHGMMPSEWPQTNYGRNNIIAIQPMGSIHAECRNGAAIEGFENESGTKVDWIGRDFFFESFNKYRTFVGSSSIFFNPSYASANPRARTEAMLSGLAVVTTRSHGEGDYIVNEVNGFASNDMRELYEYLQYLHHNPAVTQSIGRAGRRTAQDIFHSDRFVQSWVDLLNETLGGSQELELLDTHPAAKAVGFAQG